MQKEIDPFTVGLLEWHKTNTRELPWKETDDPYIIWISEIILQQTRVQQGMPYYLRFIDRFPDVFHLAKASEDEVLKYWEGLGYYSRARNLHFSAKLVVEKYGGVFPSDYDELLKLKGVGPYTAAAIASFAYGLPYAVVDGNVVRVLSRYFGIREAVDSTVVKKEINILAYQLLDHHNPGAFNQAMMDFGATACTPDNPQCMLCPLQDGCMAFAKGWVDIIPAKAKKIKKRDRYFHYFIVRNAGKIGIRRRASGIWKGLYEFYLLESSTSILTERDFPSTNGDNQWELLTDEPIKHVLTHQILYVHFYLGENIKENDAELEYVSPEKLTNYAFPKPIKSFIERHFN